MQFRRRSTGAVIDHDRKDPAAAGRGPAWTRFAFPTWWHYDVLRGLDYLRDAGHDPADARVAEAIDVVKRNRADDRRWPLQEVFDGATYFVMDDGEGQPSRWITLGAMRVLDWFAPGA